uniref:RING-type domain-containing protein n=1 Tax=Pyrodinium bahamense TaxID=73915 RepID=A0A7S0ASQ1_9DINO|mmetsp:Transcript_41095/g.114228  ORF Transcript_41095/g.114228 Transcript_41095/m.114228 type:complete len:344 (+) Transcript_41095:56-1087(+)
MVATPEPVLVGASSAASSSSPTLIASTPMGEPSTMSRSLSRVGGLTTHAQPAQGQSRQVLVQRGFSTAQADAFMVRRHQEETIANMFVRWLACFACVVCLLYIVCLGILAWLVAEWCNFAGSQWFWQWGDPDAFQPGCNVPVKEWVIVLFCFSILSIIKSTFLGKKLLSCLCCWNMEGMPTEPPPLRVKMFELLYPLVFVVWDILGVHWVSYADQTCVEHHRSFLSAILGFCCVHIALAIVIYINVIGFATCLRFLLRSGVIKSPMAAPKGSLERSTQPIQASDPGLAAHPACPICLEDFNDKLPIVQTRSCKHAFHTQCLQEWLDVNRNCPLCRHDLAMQEA